MSNRLLAVLALLVPGLALAMPGAAPTKPAALAPPAAPGTGGGPDMVATLSLPLFDERFADTIIATAGEERVTLTMLAEAMAASHQEHKGGGKPAKMEFEPMLQRLLNVRLLLAEAHQSGIQDLDDVKFAVESWEKEALRERVQRDALKDVKPDAIEVEKLYREAVKEWKLRSIKFPTLDEAQVFRKAVVDGKDFGALAAEAVDAKKATGGLEASWAGRKELAPAVLGAVQLTEAGHLTDAIKLPDGFAVAKVDEIRYGESAEAKGEAEKQSVARQNKVALEAYYKKLTDSVAKVDWALVKKVNYDAKGWEKFKTDKRVLATFKGAASITVADLTEALEKQLFHGMDRGAREKKVNRLKELTMDALVSLKVVPVRAKELGITDSAEYRRAKAAYEDQIVFGHFLRKMIAPEVKVEEGAARKYYDAHLADYAFPVFYRLETVGFGARKDAEAAVAKLAAGTDVRWLRQNSERQLDPNKVSILLNDGVVSAKAMTEELRKLLDGAKPGDVRLYGEADQFFAVRVADVTPPSQQPFDQVEAEITKKLYVDAVGKAIQDYADKLRSVFPVKVFITRIGA
ncbi:MAG: peptidyl-prolyl cis-trans isomerase [Anaeromyxobacter sp.]